MGSITPGTKTRFLECECLDMSLQGADLEEVSTSDLWKKGARAQFLTEWGISTCRWVQNNGGNSVKLGQAVRWREVALMCSNGGADNSTDTKCGYTTGMYTSHSFGEVNELAGFAAVVSAGGNAAPEGQTLKINGHTSSTVSWVEFDRALTTRLDRADVLTCWHMGDVQRATHEEQVRTKGFGIACCASCADKSYMWVMEEGFHPAGDFPADCALGTHIAVGTTCGRLIDQATAARDFSIPVRPIVAVDYTTDTRYWPIRIGGPALMDP